MALSALLLVAACSGSEPVGDEETLLQAQTLREGCVAHTLDMILTAVERIAPLTEVGSIETLVDRATSDGFQVDPDPDNSNDVILRDTWFDLVGQEHAVTAWLSYHASNVPVHDPFYSDNLFVRIETLAAHVSTYSEFRIRPVAGRGLVVDGALVSSFEDDCRVSAIFPDIIALPIADQNGIESSVLIQTGNFDFEIEEQGGSFHDARAAVTGRNAFVAVNVGGFVVPGDLDLSR